MLKLWRAAQARLVDDSRLVLRWWSVRMMLFGGLLGTLLTTIPAMPVEVQSAIPVAWRAAAVAIWSIASVVTRVVKQRSLNPDG